MNKQCFARRVQTRSQESEKCMPLRKIVSVIFDDLLGDCWDKLQEGPSSFGSWLHRPMQKKFCNYGAQTLGGAHFRREFG